MTEERYSFVTGSIRHLRSTTRGITYRMTRRNLPQEYWNHCCNNSLLRVSYAGIVASPLLTFMKHRRASPCTLWTIFPFVVGVFPLSTTHAGTLKISQQSLRTQRQRRPNTSRL